MLDYKGREVIVGLPTRECGERPPEPYVGWSGEFSFVDVTERTEVTVEETDSFRIIEVIETVEEAEGGGSIDAGGSWGGGHSSTCKNVYRVRVNK